MRGLTGRESFILLLFHHSIQDLKYTKSNKENDGKPTLSVRENFPERNKAETICVCPKSLVYMRSVRVNEMDGEGGTQIREVAQTPGRGYLQRPVRNTS